MALFCEYAIGSVNMWGCPLRWCVGKFAAVAAGCPLLRGANNNGCPRQQYHSYAIGAFLGIGTEHTTRKLHLIKTTLFRDPGPLSRRYAQDL